MRLLAIITVMVALAADAYADAAPPPQPNPQPPQQANPVGAPLVMNQFPYDERDFKPYTGTGKASVEGETSTTNAKGEKQPIANAALYLTPKTSYTTDLYHSQHYMSSTFPYDSRLKRQTRKIFTDAKGKFTFAGLPQGAYFLELAVRDPRSPRWAPKYDVTVKEITLGKEEKAKIDISK